MPAITPPDDQPVADRLVAGLTPRLPPRPDGDSTAAVLADDDRAYRTREPLSVDRDRRGRLPLSGWTWRESIEAGRWAGLRPEPVVPATYCLVGGTWYRVREGVQALVVRDRAGPAAYVVVERASRYFGVMTRSDWAPALVGETV